MLARHPNRVVGRLLAAGLIFGSLSAATEVPPPSFAPLAAEFDRQCASGEFSGIVVRAHGRQLFERTCGQADIVNAVPIDRATRFKIYSTSKFMTALAIMRLVEGGTIRLDDSIRQYIPDVPAEWAPVTVRQLLNHTSGIQDLTGDLVYHFRADHPSAMRAALAALTVEERVLKTPPGQAFAYNNFGFELLADAAANVAGKPFAQLVETLVFQPAGMKTASVEAPRVEMGHLVPVSEDGLAVGYNGEPGKLVPAVNWAFVQLGAGAVRASVDDFVALDEALNARRIVSRRTLEMMTTGAVPAPTNSRSAGTSFGLGTIVRLVNHVRMEGHTGGVNGYISDFERFPDHKAMMIVLSNRGFAKTAWLREGVANALNGRQQRG